MLCCHHPLIHIDEAVFGPDAGEFKPKRFVGNPALKKEVGAGSTEREGGALFYRIVSWLVSCYCRCGILHTVF